MFNIIFSIMMSVMFPLQVMANPVSTSVKLNFDEQSSYVNQMRDFLNIYSEKYYVDKALAELKKVYTSKADRLYMQKIIAIGEKPSQLAVTTTLHTIEITATGIPKIILSDFDPKNASLKINGKEFKVSKNVPLEETNKKLSDLLLPSEKTSFMQLFIPKAHARGEKSSTHFVALFVVAPTAIAASKAEETSDRINAIIKTCEDRDERVHFDNSATRLLLRKYESDSYNFDFPDVNFNTECSVWAKEILKIRKEVSTSVAANWCLGIKKANKCIEDYKLGRPKKVQDSPKSPVVPSKKIT